MLGVTSSLAVRTNGENGLAAVVKHDSVDARVWIIRVAEINVSVVTEGDEDATAVGAYFVYLGQRSRITHVWRQTLQNRVGLGWCTFGTGKGATNNLDLRDIRSREIGRRSLRDTNLECHQE